VESSLAIYMSAISPNALSFVVFGTVAFSVLMSLVFLLTRRPENLYDQIGQGGLTMESDPGGDSLASGIESPAARAERELEIRQMLEARSERLVRQGHAPLDIEAELARLEWSPSAAGSAGEAALTEEVRQIVLARNERRKRQGLDALDVETEVQRTLAELTP
jgi:hypothetical protein